MDSLAMHLALHGALVLTVALIAGLLLYRAILRNGNVSGWHLLHSGGSGRGVLLIALAGTFQLISLPPSLLSALVWLMVFFAWTSVLAMSIVAISGEHGFDWSGPTSNKIAYGLYAVGVVAVFPAVFLIITGLLNALKR